MVSLNDFKTLEDRRGSTKDRIVIEKQKRDIEILRSIPQNFVFSPDGYALTENLPNKYRFVAKLEKLKESNPEAQLSDVVLPNQVRYSVKQRLSKFNGLEIKKRL